MIKSFVENFIKDIYKERILFELSSNKPNKREKAFTKLLDYKEYFNSDIEKIDLTHLMDEEILKVINAKYNAKECYSLKYDKKLQLEKAVINTINSYMLDILIIDEKNIIYIGEVGDHNEGGMASIKFISYLKEKMRY